MDTARYKPMIKIIGHPSIITMLYDHVSDGHYVLYTFHKAISREKIAAIEVLMATDNYVQKNIAIHWLRTTLESGLPILFKDIILGIHMITLANRIVTNDTENNWLEFVYGDELYINAHLQKE